MSELMMEVNEAVRADQMRALWNRYGQWLIGVVVLAVLGTALGVLWRNHVNSVLTEQTSALMAVLQNEAQSNDTAEKLAGLSKKTDLPLKSVAQLYQAQKLEQAKDLAGAQKIFGEIYNERKFPAITQHLARVQYVRLGILLDRKPEELLPVIEATVTSDKKSFRFSALELKALLLQKQGKQNEANQVFKLLTDDSDVPGTLRARAKSLIRYED